MLNSQISGIKSLFRPSEALKGPISVLTEASSAYIPIAFSDEHYYTALSKGSSLSPQKQISCTESGFPVYSAFSGNVEDILNIKHPLINDIKAVKVSNPEFLFSIPAEKYDIDSYSPDEIIEQAKLQGIVDETDGERLYKKLQRIKAAGAKILVCNALSDTPFEAANTALLRTYGEHISKALVAASYAVGASRCAIAVFDGKKAPQFPQSIGQVPVMKINFRYPSKPLLDMQIRGWGGGDQIGVGALFALYQALTSHSPQTFVCLTVDGTAVKEPKNLFVPIGVTIGDVVRDCVLSDLPHLFVVGGIMNGVTCLPETPVTATTSSIVVNDIERYESEKVCSGCSECVGICPKKLLPVHIMTALKRGNSKMLS
ncbi:MAG: hypothetical protein IJ462_03345, partial [Clostridia bacterium]|nr:hypothetical protein [Clostridia bacterium]